MHPEYDKYIGATQNHNIISAMNDAIMQNDTSMARFLIDVRAGENVLGNSILTAIEKGNIELVDYIYQNDEASRSLMWSGVGYVVDMEMVRHLLEKYIDVFCNEDIPQLVDDVRKQESVNVELENQNKV